MGNALRELREEHGLSQGELAEKMGFKDNSPVSQRESGKARISPGDIRKIEKALDLPAGAFEERWRSHWSIQRPIRGNGIPVINRSPAGEVVEYDEWGPDSGEGYDYIDRGNIADELAFSVVVTGNSMEPAIRDGDLLVLSPVMGVPKPAVDLEEGMVVFVRIGEDADVPGCTIARWYPDPIAGMVRLHKDNPAHPPIIVPREHIVQLAVKVQHRRDGAF